ncbi:MAG: 4-hydroxy-tetrahydrodipicolinate reductase [Fervidobacterium sp.]|nr:4-hydroxy-tetrahydrodipicolinate reductase [Fervidobacterium sp.]
MKFGIVGVKGKMGKEIADYFLSMGDELVLKVDVDVEDVMEKPEVIVDFSHRSALEKTIDLCTKFSCPLVIGTTALTEDDFNKLRHLAESVPVVQSYNFSEGINLLKLILQKFHQNFNSWDMTIVEIHHNKKKDAPSGTALMLKNTLGKEIQINSLRVGGVFGEHTVIIANDGEVIELTHRALSRRAFSIGARRAALFSMTKKNGFYSFSDVVEQMGG